MKKKVKAAKVVVPKGSKLPSKKKSDFFFITSVSVFAAMTIFASQFMINDQKAIQQAQRQKALDMAPLDILPNGKPFPGQGEIRRTYPSVSPKATIKSNDVPHGTSPSPSPKVKTSPSPKAVKPTI